MLHNSLLVCTDFAWSTSTISALPSRIFCCLHHFCQVAVRSRHGCTVRGPVLSSCFASREHSNVFKSVSRQAAACCCLSAALTVAGVPDSCCCYSCCCCGEDSLRLLKISHGLLAPLPCENTVRTLGQHGSVANLIESTLCPLVNRDGSVAVSRQHVGMHATMKHTPNTYAHEPCVIVCMNI